MIDIQPFSSQLMIEQESEVRGIEIFFYNDALYNKIRMDVSEQRFISYKIVVYIGRITSRDLNHLTHNSHYDVLTTTLWTGCS